MSRVLYLIDTGGPGGAETVLAHLASRFQGAGWASKVILPRKDWLFDRLKDSGVEATVLSGHGSLDLRFLRSLVRELRQFNPALIHAHLLGSGVYGTLASVVSTDCPLVCTFHGIPDVDPRDPYLPIKGRILSRDRNRVVYVSRQLRRVLEPRLGIPPHLGETIHNGVPFPEVPATEPPEIDLPLARGDFLVGAVGNVRPAKDYANLFRAAQVVCEARSDIHFAVVGEGKGELFQSLLQLREELGLGSRVHFPGFQKDIRPWMDRFDVFVSSSSEEGLPLASVEAMGAAKPVVLTECGGIPELVVDGRTGLLVPVKDSGALAEGILSLVEDRDLAFRLGTEASRWVRSRFSLETMVSAYERLYLEMAGARSRPHA